MTMDQIGGNAMPLALFAYFVCEGPELAGCCLVRCSN